MMGLTVMLGLIIAAVAVAAMVLYAYSRGRREGAEQQARFSAEMHSNDQPSVFGKGVSAEAASRSLIDVMRSAIILTDGLGNTRYVSHRAEQLGVVESRHIVSSEIRDILSQVAADGRVRDREVEMKASAPSGRITDQTSMVLRIRIGRIASVDRHGVGNDGDGVADNGGATELYAIFLEDVSELKHFEQMRRDFVTNVSHELKTPAGAISLLAETVSSAADDPDAVRYFSSRISKESERLTELVQKLIELQKVQNDDMTKAEDSQPICVPKVVREAVAENEVQAEAKHIELRMYFRDDSVGELVGTDNGDADEHPEIVSDGTSQSGPGSVAKPVATADGGAVKPKSRNGEITLEDEDAIVVLGNEENLKTAVKNLVENAIHYSPEGTHVGVSVRRADSTVTIRVVDQGIGIPQEAQARIFERFYRVDPARSRATGGTGLGLSITKHIIQEMGGKISVWSKPNEGSTFTIELPSVR